MMIMMMLMLMMMMIMMMPDDNDDDDDDSDELASFTMFYLPNTTQVASTSILYLFLLLQVAALARVPELTALTLSGGRHLKGAGWRRRRRRRG